MEQHPLDHPVASDRSFEVLEMRRLRGELVPTDIHGRLYRVDGFRRFVPDVEEEAQPTQVTR